MTARRPFGSWPSPLTAETVVAASVRLGRVAADGRAVWWDEGRPDEGGRVAVVRLDAGGEVAEATPPGFSARSRVHEYGGGAWWVHDGVLFAVGADDQRIHRIDPGAPPLPLTPAPPPAPGGRRDRFADGVVVPGGEWLICVRERHDAPAEPPRNEIVAVRASRADGAAVDEPVALVSGPDFVASPRVDPSGRSLAWVQWDHPHMPWDSTELWTGELAFAPPRPAGSSTPRLRGARRVAGGRGEALSQPEWSPGGTLHALSDRSGWSNLYRYPGPGGAEPEPVVTVDADIGLPPWVLGGSRYGFLDDGRIGFACSREGLDRLGATDAGGGWTPIEAPWTHVPFLAVAGGDLLVVGAGPVTEPEVARLDARGRAGRRVLRPPRDLPLGPEWFSRAEPLSFPTSGGETAHALFYRPVNPRVETPGEGAPPLVVTVHGGPTSAARPSLSLAVQFWTTRGFAVVDVDHRGSTGYGRAYRRALDGRWGEADVADCVAVVEHLAAVGRVDPVRVVIRGSSAGGYTVLRAVTSTSVFAAGISYYGIADLEALVADNHKFEARYLDGLIGPWPERADLYRERSPVRHVDRLSTPLLLLQGLDDPVVTPSQAETIVEALRRRGVRYEYLAFEGEEHGFRRSENVRRALEAELAFVRDVTGVAPPAELP